MEIDKHKDKFGNLAKDYTKYRKPYTDDVFKLLFSLIEEKKVKVLDLACGTGKSTEPIVRDKVSVFGVDHDGRMIGEAKEQAKIKNLNISYSVAKAENLPFPDEYFDVVTVGTAFHWFVNEISTTEIKRVLKKKGLFFTFWVLITKDIPEEDEIPSNIFHSYNWEKVPSELRDLSYISSFLTKNSFQNVSTVRIPYVDQSTVEDRVGLLKTGSSYELLSEENKKLFLEEVESTLISKLGGRKHFLLEEEIHICYGFKE